LATKNRPARQKGWLVPSVELLVVLIVQEKFDMLDQSGFRQIGHKWKPVYPDGPEGS